MTPSCRPPGWPDERPAGRPLRVLMVCARYLPEAGGVETHVHEVARRLSASGRFDVTVLTTDRTGGLPRREMSAGVKVCRVPAWPRSRDYYVAPQIASVVGQRGRWDLVHCQGIHTPVPLIAMLAARRAGVPYLVTFHTGGHAARHRNAMRSMQWRLAGPLLRQAASLIAVSSFEAEAMTRHARLGSKPVTVIDNGGTLPPARAGTTAVPGRIVSAGRLERYKGHQRVIRALPFVVRQDADAHVVVLGRGPYEPELRALASRLGIADRVAITHVPPRDREAMATALAEASVVAALSDYEAHPIAVMEALSAGRPVVGYDTAGLADLVARGWVRGVAPGAAPAVVASELVQAMSRPAGIPGAELPTWDSCAAALEQVYQASCRQPALGHDVRARVAPSAGRADSGHPVRVILPKPGESRWIRLGYLRHDLSVSVWCGVTVSSGGLTGRGLLQSREEWAVRNHVLAQSLSQLAVEYLPGATGHGLDIGCQSGELTDYLNAFTSLSWAGIDPALPEPAKSPEGASLNPAAADSIPYPDEHFDCLVLANVFEHIPQERRHASFTEMYRVLRSGGILVGQLPNPYFPVESHSRLPFMGWLPMSLQRKYWSLAPVPWEHDFFTVTIRHVRAEARNAGFEIVKVSNFNYPPAALPKSVRPLASIMSLPMKYFPWAWQFVIRRPAEYA